MSKYTPNYQIPQYESEDKPNLRDQYNAAMDVIDNQLKKESDDIVVAIATANDAKKTAEEAESGVEVLEPKVEKNTTDIAGLETVVAGHTDDIEEMKPEIATNTENIAKNTEDIGKNTADIEQDRQNTETAIAGLTQETQDLSGDIASAEADITTIKNTINDYGSAVEKDWINVVNTQSANQGKLPTNFAVDQFVTSKLSDFGIWEVLGGGYANNNIAPMQVRIRGWVNKQLKLVMIQSEPNSTGYTGVNIDDVTSTAAFTIPAGYRPKFEITSQNYTSAVLGGVDGLFVGTNGDVSYWFGSWQSTSAQKYLHASVLMYTYA